MAYWEIEQDQSDGQYDLLREGQVMAFGLVDMADVAEAIQRFKPDGHDIIEDAEGRSYTFEDFVFRFG